METTNADAGTNVSSGDLGHAVDKIKAEPLDIELEKLHPSFVIASVQTERINGKEDEQIDSTDVYIENEMTLSSHNALVKEELDGVSDDLQTYCRSSPPKLVAQEQIGQVTAARPLITTAETCTTTSLTSSQNPNLDDQNNSITNVQTIKSELPESLLHFRLPMESGSPRHNLATNQPVLVTHDGLQLSVEMLQDMYSHNILTASVAASNYIQIDSLQQSSNSINCINTEAFLPSTFSNCIKTETSEQMKAGANNSTNYSQITCTGDRQLPVCTSDTQQQQSYNDQLQQTTNITKFPVNAHVKLVKNEQEHGINDLQMTSDTQLLYEKNAGIALQKDTDVGNHPSPQNVHVKQLLKNLITHRLTCSKDESTNKLLLDASEKHTTSHIQKQQLTNNYAKHLAGCIKGSGRVSLWENTRKRSDGSLKQRRNSLIKSKRPASSQECFPKVFPVTKQHIKVDMRDGAINSLCKECNKPLSSTYHLVLKNCDLCSFSTICSVSLCSHMRLKHGLRLTLPKEIDTGYCFLLEKIWPNLLTCGCITERSLLCNQMAKHLAGCIKGNGRVSLWENTRKRSDGSLKQRRNRESFKVDATENEPTVKFVMENKKATVKTEEGKLIEWYIGDYLWAKMTGSPWWPCIVSLEPDLGIYTKILDKSRMYHVHFFGESHKTGWVHSSETTKFDYVDNKLTSAIICDKTKSGEMIKYKLMDAIKVARSCMQKTRLAQGKPVVEIPQSFHKVKVGTQITIPCTISSKLPITSVYWFVEADGVLRSISCEHNMINYSVDCPSLTIKRARLCDIGTYKCYALNIAGTGISNLVKLTVTSTGKPIVKMKNHVCFVKAGEDVTIGCDITSSYELQSVWWQKSVDGKPTIIRSKKNLDNKYTNFTVGWQKSVGGEITITKSKKNFDNKYSNFTTMEPSLTIYKAETSDVGKYKCFAVNKYGESHSIDTFLKIPEKPIFTVKKNLYCVKAGDCLTIECDIFSECGLKSVWWQKSVGSNTTIIRSKLADKKYSFIPARPSLTIYSTEGSDAGQYMCCAVNIAGENHSTTVGLRVVNQTLYFTKDGIGCKLVEKHMPTWSCTPTENEQIVPIMLAKAGSYSVRIPVKQIDGISAASLCQTINNNTVPIEPNDKLQLSHASHNILFEKGSQTQINNSESKLETEEKSSCDSEEKCSGDSEEKSSGNSEEKSSGDSEEKSSDDSEDTSSCNSEEKSSGDSEGKSSCDSEKKSSGDSEKKSSGDSEEKSSGDSEEKSSCDSESVLQTVKKRKNMDTQDETDKSVLRKKTIDNCETACNMKSPWNLVSLNSGSNVGHTLSDMELENLKMHEEKESNLPGDLASESNDSKAKKSNEETVYSKGGLDLERSWDLGCDEIHSSSTDSDPHMMSLDLKSIDSLLKSPVKSTTDLHNASEIPMKKCRYSGDYQNSPQLIPAQQKTVKFHELISVNNTTKGIIDKPKKIKLDSIKWHASRETISATLKSTSGMDKCSIYRKIPDDDDDGGKNLLDNKDQSPLKANVKRLKRRLTSSYCLREGKMKKDISEDEVVQPRPKRKRTKKSKLVNLNKCNKGPPQSKAIAPDLRPVSQYREETRKDLTTDNFKTDQHHKIRLIKENGKLKYILPLKGKNGVFDMAVDLHDSKLIRKIGNVDSINRIKTKYHETETMIKFKRMKNRKTATSVKDICSTSSINDKVENRTPLTDDTCEQTTTDPE